MVKRILLSAIFASIVSLPVWSDDVASAPTAAHMSGVLLPGKRDPAKTTGTTVPTAVAPAVVVSVDSDTDTEESVDCFYSANQSHPDCADKNHAEQH
jgi:hypothetical protein